MRVKPNLLLMLFLMLITGSVYYSCNNSVMGESYNGSIKGWVYDKTNKTPISGVRVNCSEVADTLYTDAAGMFSFPKITMPSVDYTYNVTFKKSGFADSTCKIIIRAEVPCTKDSIMLKRIAD